MSGLRVLILGGYGTFGGRLARLLADEYRITLIIAGRDKAKAEAFCSGLPEGPAREAVVFDRESDITAQIRILAPNVVVDASGPFQRYGEDSYRVAHACVEHGCHYMDLADGAGFVEGIAELDAEARARGVFVLSGVSTCPVLTSAVVRELTRDLATVDAVRGGIAPSPYAGVGLNVVRAITSYAGKRVRLVRDGEPAEGRALMESRRYTIAPPGRLPLKSVLFSLVDVPDLRLLPKLWPELKSVWFGAGPVPEVLHRMLMRLSWLVRLRIFRSLEPLAPLFHRVINVVRWGEHRGGMFVEIEGRRANGERRLRSWHLLAEGDDGPLIPSMAVEAIVRLMLLGKVPEPGARPAVRELEVTEYDVLFNRRQITTGVREERPASDPLYQRVLSDIWWKLPAPLQEIHSIGNRQVAEGVAQVDRGTTKGAALAAMLFGLPPAGRDVPLRVTFERIEGGEVWRRDFGGHVMKSVQTEGQGKDQFLLCERFGPLSVSLALVYDQSRLRLIVRRWSLFGIPMPMSLAPYGDASEFSDGGRFRFHVEIRHIFTGLIVRYQGWLVPVR